MSTGSKRILYVGWIGRNNIGDEVCWEAFRHLCKKHSTAERTIEAVPYYSNKQKAGIAKGQYDMVLLGGGSLLSSNMYLNVMLEAQKRGIPTAIWGTGLDYMTYNSLPIPGRKFKRVKFSNGLTTLKVARVIKQSKRVGIRGIITQNALRKMSSRPTRLIGDPGLSCTWSPQADIFQKEGIDPSSRMVAVNWGTSFNRVYGANEERVFRILARTLRGMARDGYHIVLYPMWDQDIPHIRKLYRNIAGSGKVDMVSNMYSSSSVVHFLKRMKFTINYKLHANVLSAAAEVPFLSIAYRSKCIDFAHTMGLGHDVVSTGDAHLETILRKKINALNLYRSKKILIIRNKNKRFRKLTETYFEQILSHL